MRRDRSAVGRNRTGLVLLGVVGVLLGAAILVPAAVPALGWTLGDAARAVARWPWWPAAAGAVGVAAVVTAAAWLVAQRPGAPLRRLGLGVTDDGDRLALDPAAAVRTANAVLAEHHDVVAARLTLVHRRGALEVGGAVVLDADGVIDLAAARVREVVADLGTVLELPQVRSRVRLEVRR
ncbi:hypothetical protein [Litorihabitans aurantiacus]|uniref:Alkaline shock response membrane anchor protein AmaP n=1 Tax=Litorihabitans aurantiacus TaxID=1930061 RepID=A0AA38CRJ9_9MICO|nr:hypothetical protein [Litorihabitans aurantiacus]GMA31991.1 hypothetical protein GCM10025875_19830 [Litorihabitans aurantiacus]